MPAGSASRLGKLLRGELVYGQAHWPDERSEANQRRAIWPLCHTGQQWEVASDQP